MSKNIMDNKINWNILYQAVVELNQSKAKMTRTKSIIYILALIIEIAIFILVCTHMTEFTLFLAQIGSVLVFCILYVLFSRLDKREEKEEENKD